MTRGAATVRETYDQEFPMSLPHARSRCSILTVTRKSQPHLAQDDKARLVRGQSEHDEVRIQAVQAVPQRRVPARPPALLADVGHDLVLALARHIRVRQDHLECVVKAQSRLSSPSSCKSYKQVVGFLRAISKNNINEPLLVVFAERGRPQKGTTLAITFALCLPLIETAS